MTFAETGYYLHSSHGWITDGFLTVIARSCTDPARGNWQTTDGGYKHWMNPHLEPEFYGLTALLANIAWSYLQNPRLDHSKISYKVAGKPHFWHPHQDAGYKRTRWRGVTIGLFLDDVTEKNGAIKLWPGSHKKLLPHTRGTTAHDVMHQARIPEAYMPQGTPVAMEGPAGTVLVMDALTVHASGPNTDSGERRILLIEFEDMQPWYKRMNPFDR